MMISDFVEKCFGYGALSSFKFNYGNNEFVRHKLFTEPVPYYIKKHYKIYDWMSYVRMVIDRIGDESWLRAECALYGIEGHVHCVIRYNGWEDVMEVGGRRLRNTGPNDVPLDVFWWRLIDFACAEHDCVQSHDDDLHTLNWLFMSVIWFNMCENDSLLKCMRVRIENHTSPYSTK
uniref:PlxyGVORF90 protein n=1 Tax=Plutella xylostella granulovirus TaxID=98383 RepID=A0A1B2CSJ3_9BBAC|nr:PlxyGVORF90 protein [Plutella xylostella granulovirus]